jgi:Reverse transcriptase (RNA-dependent DNA polymerase)
MGYLLVTSVMIDFGFTKCVSDPCIFILKRGKDMVMVGGYVDDILIAGNNRSLINDVKGYIEYHFKIKDLGSVKTMLGINISHNVLTIDQSTMIKKIAEEIQPYNDALINSPLG